MEQRRAELKQADAELKQWQEFEPEPIPESELREVQGSCMQEQWRLVDELLLIYPVKNVDKFHCSVVGIRLNDYADFLDTAFEDITVSTAMGYIVALLQSIARFTGIHLPYEMVAGGSRSYILTLAAEDEPSQARSPTLLTPHSADTSDFELRWHGQPQVEVAEDSKRAHDYPHRHVLPLYYEETNPLGFRRAVTLLGSNIEAMCGAVGVPAHEVHSLHLLPNILKVIQAISLTRWQYMDTPVALQNPTAEQLRHAPVQDADRAGAHGYDGHSPTNSISSSFDDFDVPLHGVGHVAHEATVRLFWPASAAVDPKHFTSQSDPSIADGSRPDTVSSSILTDAHLRTSKELAQDIGLSDSSDEEWNLL